MEVHTPTCPFCGTGSVLEVDFLGWVAWDAREAPAHVALPELSEAERILLEYGLHEHCAIPHRQRLLDAFGIDDE